VGEAWAVMGMAREKVREKVKVRGQVTVKDQGWVGGQGLVQVMVKVLGLEMGMVMEKVRELDQGWGRG
jgi:hypothetical protein